ncbi:MULTISPECIES: hypothetical protein [Candidatus Nitrosocaldus]|uniref:Uncharacterized protein n=1 Tax=Candidatus Nitrosocaldus cavascurensis TaxID=2058097 RepID=A0A2K5AQD9_9ARCH|nr:MULTISPECIES: hypothetical protein [Candidatus Nitrosocaldus]SPC33850.1 conserved protein of unknown function [Candidatus Nitrosocaldus cavascurensis]
MYLEEDICIEEEMMRVNLDDDEHIIAILPKVWLNETGLLGLLKRSKEGILAMTNKSLVFVAKRMVVTRDEISRYIDLDERIVKVSNIKGYSERDLDEDISNEKDSVLIPLISIIDVREVKVRRSKFLRVTFITNDGKSKTYDYGIAESITSYPIRQPLLFYDISWEPWIRLINAYR